MSKDDEIILTSKFFNNMDVNTTTELKGFAILIIIYLHVSGLFQLPNYFHGEFGVDIFVILSGFGLTLSYLHKNTKPIEFLKKRLFRLLPSYWIVLIFIFFMNKYVMKISIDFKDYIIHFLGIHSLFEKSFYTISPQFWYMTLILTLYILFYLLQNIYL
ncbi:hypothetical protein AK964_13115 [Clostridium butyricum]|nr:hypothetical protein AK964_13115 [Clostridium butyricum]